MISVVAAALMLVPAAAQAQNAQTREGLGFSFGVGGGSVGASCDYCSSNRETGPSGYVRLGVHITPNLLLGGEVNAWTHSEGNTDATLGIYTFNAQWYPSADAGLYLKGGFGFAGYMAKNGANEVTGSAVAVGVGAGYDMRMASNFSLTPFMNYLVTSKGDIKYNGGSTPAKISANLLQVGIGFTWH